MSRREPDPTVSTAARWATRVTSIGLEFALPALLGGYLDKAIRTGRLFTILGAALGFTAGMIHTLAIARQASKEMAPAGRTTPTGSAPDAPHDDPGQVDNG